MIRLHDGQITDLLLNRLRRNLEIQSLSFAILQEKQRILRLADSTRTAAAIDELPEEVLDALAVELRTQYYGVDLPIETKRSLIKNTFLWYQKAGTVAAVKELATVAYGDCNVQEWFQYGGKPGYFKVETVNPGNAFENLGMFVEMLSKVKRLSAHFEKVNIDFESEHTVGVGIANQTFLEITYRMETPSEEEFDLILTDENGEFLYDETGNVLVD